MCQLTCQQLLREATVGQPAALTPGKETHHLNTKLQFGEKQSKTASLIGMSYIAFQ